MTINENEFHTSLVEWKVPDSLEKTTSKEEVKDGVELAKWDVQEKVDIFLDVRESQFSDSEIKDVNNLIKKFKILEELNIKDFEQVNVKNFKEINVILYLYHELTDNWKKYLKVPYLQLEEYFLLAKISNSLNERNKLSRNDFNRNYRELLEKFPDFDMLEFKKLINDKKIGNLNFYLEELENKKK